MLKEEKFKPEIAKKPEFDLNEVLERGRKEWRTMVEEKIAKGELKEIDEEKIEIKELKEIPREKIYQHIFRLEEEPKVLTQCCNDLTRQPKGGGGCEMGRLEEAQKLLDQGKTVVLESFGRRRVLGSGKTSVGEFCSTDWIEVYTPGDKIDIEERKEREKKDTIRKKIMGVLKE